MKRSRVLFIVIVCLSAIPGLAQNSVIFDNESGEPALVKLIGPSNAEVQVPNGAQARVDAAAGPYTIKVRYGTPGNYRYSKGDEFAVTETATSRSATTITLHKVIDGNYSSRPISEAEFGGMSTASSGPAQPAAGPATRPQQAAAPAGPVAIAWSQPSAEHNNPLHFYKERLGGITITSDLPPDRDVCLLVKSASADGSCSGEVECYMSLNSLGRVIPERIVMLAAVAANEMAWPKGVYNVTMQLHTTRDSGSRGDPLSNELTVKLTKEAPLLEFPGYPGRPVEPRVNKRIHITP